MHLGRHDAPRRLLNALLSRPINLKRQTLHNGTLQPKNVVRALCAKFRGEIDIMRPVVHRLSFPTKVSGKIDVA